MSLRMEIHTPAHSSILRMAYAKAQELLVCNSLEHFTLALSQELGSTKNKNGTRVEAFVRVYAPKNERKVHLMYFQKNKILATITEA